MIESKVKPRSFKKSEALLARSLKVIPSGTQTFSKGHTQYPVGASPLFLERGQGSRVWDVDGNEYLDLPLALGPNILGYGNPAVDEAVLSQWKAGASFSLPHRLEVEVAEMLIERIPCAEMVRFGKNGSDVTSAAVRVARAYTGREMIACCGYHGWQDWYIGTTTRAVGVPKAVRELTKTFDYNDLSSLEKLFAAHPGKIAAVILEPIGVIDPKPGFLEGVKKLAAKNGAILIFDEVVTGFRLARGGAQELFKVTPDLACFGKAMANGLPISCVLGKREIMKSFDDIFFSFTAGGETVSLAAAKATLLELDRQDAYKHLWKVGDRLRDGFNALAKSAGLDKNVKCLGPGPHTACQFKDDRGQDSLLVRSLLQQEAAARGVLFLVGHNMSTAFSEADADRALAVFDESLRVVRKALDSGKPETFLRGKAVQPVFRKA